ncbi:MULTISPECIES: glycosyltransferase [unclassified Moorena]|uniref:glycosyltransferase family 2 protein n=1 Tax=unclassified Moorena TaxID=2683338 RepID=UPI0013BE89BF|nr:MULTISPECIES: glycosyltransferase [unclassified Moorena]NEP31272.1 glycosyltransferase [Moorena sp. SIO3B2]NEQ11884.1 glycosyltransferase [Moorena sp. SIO4E2]NES40579.1 glycosyltransferase [Moorena sp. SIO2C4]
MCEKTLPISVVIPTWKRTTVLLVALKYILNCSPRPAEILVHIDAGDQKTEQCLRQVFSQSPVHWFQSNTTQGPGGGRNLLIRKASFPLIACFDDDSWPLDSNYFQIAADLFAAHPEAAVLSAQEVRPGMNSVPTDSKIGEIACFQNCACLIRREAFLNTRGYLPLRYAYGMEEADVALQLLDSGWNILNTASLRVYHDTDLKHHGSVPINAAHIANTALLAYLRYPAQAWPLGVLQVLNRVKYAASIGRWRGIQQGLLQIPDIMWKYRNERQTVGIETLRLSRKLSSSKSQIETV